ncbi:MAG TPA: CPBP family intramembrane glutamic endopeptidase, partial [Gemmatimonadales bacterium]|nr:CPBP family intramembrane glutamic endopeptidase [Gemmatimonadales bacterium]
PKAIGWSVAFLLLGIAVSGTVMSLWAQLAYGDLLRGLRALSEPGPTQFIAAGVSQLVGFSFATWIIGFRALRLSRSDLRLASPRVGVPGLAIGLGLGAGAAGVALLAAVLVADSHWSRDAGDLGDYVSQVAKTSLVLAPAALSEEVMFRGIPLVLLAAVIGRGTALVLIAGLIFALFHVLNPDITALGMGNIALAGIFLGLAFYAPGGLWTAFGAHLGWNATLAALDAPVSGLPFRIPFIDYHAGDPTWLSGGRFGPEGGLLGTAALTAALLVMVRLARRDNA